MIVDGNPQGQHGGQMNLAFGFVYVLDHDRHSPVLSKGSGLGVNFLAWRSWAFGHNRARLGIPPEGIIRVVLQVSNADKFVAERLSCALRLPNRRGCR